MSEGTFAGTRGNDDNAPMNEPARAGGSGRLGQRIFDEVMRGSA